MAITSTLYRNKQERPNYYHSTMRLDTIPQIDIADLTPKSSLKDAFHAFVWSDFIQSKLASGSTRAHEPYLSLASLMSLVTIEEGATRRFAATFRDKDLKKLAGNTKNQILGKLTNLYRWLYDYGLVESNPWRDMARAPTTPNRRRVRKLTKEEIEHVLNYLDNVKHRKKMLPSTLYGDMFRLSLLTAMRYGEVVALTAENYFPEQKHLIITAELSKTSTARKVFLSDEALAILNRYLPANPEDRFFPVSYAAVTSIFYQYQKATGKDVFFYLSRHTAISDYGEKCTSINELRAFSGHASIAAAQRYLHVDYDALKDTVLDRLNNK